MAKCPAVCFFLACLLFLSLSLVLPSILVHLTTTNPTKSLYKCTVVKYAIHATHKRHQRWTSEWSKSRNVHEHKNTTTYCATDLQFEWFANSQKKSVKRENQSMKLKWGLCWLWPKFGYYQSPPPLPPPPPTTTAAMTTNDKNDERCKTMPDEWWNV